MFSVLSALTVATDAQKPVDVAVVIPTVLRPTLLRAVRSVYRQDLDGRIQILIGVDKPLENGDFVDRLLRERPESVNLTILDLGYSTSVRHGGFYSNQFSGAIRTILSYAANSGYVAYLDDDDWWARDHLSSLLSVVSDNDWAFSYRWLVDRETEWPICRDEWDSLGPGRGINQQRFGGFVSPSNLLLSKSACHFIFPFWALSPYKDGTGEDRLIFRELLQRKWAASEKYSCFYEMPREVQLHSHHQKEFAQRGIRWIYERNLVDNVIQLHGEAANLFAIGATIDAIAKCNSALSLNPHHAKSLHLLSLAEWNLGNKASALQSIAHAMAVDDSDDAVVATWKQMRAP